jgi:hypothetical protein
LSDIALVDDTDGQSGLWVANELGVLGDRLCLLRSHGGLRLLFLLGLLLRGLLGGSLSRSGRGFSVGFGLLQQG